MCIFVYKDLAHVVQHLTKKIKNAMIGIEVYPEIEKTKMFKHLFFYDNICMKTLKAVFCFWSLRYYSLHNK